MEKKVYLGLLLDFYGQMLTQRQRALMELYCQEDYSLSEIAQLTDISRQGVRDALVRSERSLERMEQQLHFVQRYAALQSGLRALERDLSQQGLECFAIRVNALLADWEGQ